MLDALVAEARLRWGLDLAAGLQVVAAEHLVATPLEPSRPALIVPGGGAPDRTAAADASAPGRSDRIPPLAAVLPGRHGPGGDDPIAVLRRLYPADHPVGRFGAADGHDRAT